MIKLIKLKKQPKEKHDETPGPDFHSQLNKGECDFECSICIYIMAEPIILECKHAMCMACFIDITEKNRVPLCPICRRELKSMLEPTVNREL